MRIERRILHGLVDDVWAAVDNASIAPVLSCIRLDVNAGRIAATASDIEVYAESTREHDHVGDAASVLLPARMLREILKKGGSKTVTITTEQTEYGKSITVQMGKFRASLPAAFDADDFPSRLGLPDGVSWAPVNAELTRAAMQSVVFATAKENDRYHLSGVRIESADNDRLFLVATDGRRMAVRELPGSGIVAPPDGIQVPAHGCRLMMQLLQHEDVSIAMASDVGVFLQTAGGRFLAVRPLQAAFPGWRRIIPDDTEWLPAVRVHRQTLLAALTRVSLVLDNSGSVVVEFKGETLSLTSDSDRGGAHETLDCTPVPDGETIAARFNPRYWMDALRVMESERVKVQTTSAADSPWMLTGVDDHGWRYLVMPQVMDR